MKQRWLIKPLKNKNETTTPAIQLDSQTQVDLIVLMADAIEYLYQRSMTHETKNEESTDE